MAGIKRIIMGAAALLLFAQSVAFADEILDRAKRLMQQNNPQAAYQLLAPLESKRAGEVDFDYLLGIAALDSGRREQAVFALERVLAVNPNHTQARAEIARAYFEMGEKENAKREFQNVRNANPPEAVKRSIDRYLSALEVGPSIVNGYVEIGFGYDSNVNSATASGQIALPVFAGQIATVSPSGVKQSDNFTTATGAVNVVYGFSPEWAVVGGAAANGKFDNRSDDFNTATLDGNLGLRWSPGKEVFTLAYQGQDFEVAYDDFRRANGGIAQWQHNYSEYSQVSLFAQAADLTYPTQSPRDAMRTIGGVAFGYGWDTPSQPVVFGSLYGGDEKDKDENFQYLGNKPVGVRFGGQRSITESTSVFGLVSYERRVYGADDPTFLVVRRDKQTDLRVGVNYTFSPGWALIPQVAYTDNESNIELYKYQRTMAYFVVRKTF
jgi:tetratricopeptide (TPR) repeat protein